MPPEKEGVLPMTFDALVRWAGDRAVSDIMAVGRQIREYGSIDLELMGMGLRDMTSVPHDDDDAEMIGLELALVFYLQGKIARAVSAISAGQRPSADTRRDIRVYAMMWEHVCQFGHWKVEPDSVGDYTDPMPLRYGDSEYIAGIATEARGNDAAR